MVQMHSSHILTSFLPLHPALQDYLTALHEMDLAGFVYLARQKTLSYQRCMKEVTHSQSTYIQQVGIGSCMYNVEPLYVFDRDI